MKKITPIKWLEEATFAIIHLSSLEDADTLRSMIRHAKELEKEQLLEAYRNGRTDEQSGIDKWHNRTALQYYNDTYNP